MLKIFTTLFFLTICLLPLGCRKEAKRRVTLPPAGNGTPATDVAEASQTAVPLTPTASELSLVQGLSNERFERSLRVEAERVDPSRDGWESEAFSERAQTQLDHLAAWIVGGGAGDSVPSGIVGGEFSCTPLRPEGLVPAFAESGIDVKRWTRKADRTGQLSAMRGPTGLSKACQELFDLHPQSSQVKFKIVRVEFDGTGALTEVHCHLSAEEDTVRWQQNATWHCRWSGVGSDQRPLLTSIELTDFEEVRARGSAPQFVDCTVSALSGVSSYKQQLAHGLDYWRDRLDWRFGWEVVGAHGLAVGDVNADGLEDIYVCETGGLPNRLLIQNTDGTLRDASRGSGVDYLEPAHSALLLDLDNDGDQDLVLASGVFVVFLENNGQGRFERRFVGGRRSMVRSLAAADFDNNGLLDVYVCGYSSRDAHGDSVGLGRPMPYHDANNGAPNFLVANRGEFVFDDVTDMVGLDANNRRFSYAAAWEDYDNDGDLDLYVANDFGRNNLYRNDGGTFTDVAAAAGVEDIAAGMSVSWGDYNRDGLPDLYVGNMFSSAGNRIAYQRQFKAGDDDQTLAAYRRHARGNSLFENVGDGTFRDVSREVAVTEARWAWSSNFVDINNDGWDDLVIANGMITGTEGPGDL